MALKSEVWRGRYNCNVIVAMLTCESIYCSCPPWYYLLESLPPSWCTGSTLLAGTHLEFKIHYCKLFQELRSTFKVHDEVNNGLFSILRTHRSYSRSSKGEEEGRGEIDFRWFKRHRNYFRNSGPLIIYHSSMCPPYSQESPHTTSPQLGLQVPGLQSGCLLSHLQV